MHPSRLRRVLATMLDENEFLSPHGIRGISRYHKDHPFVLHVDGQEYRVAYDPAESTTGTFGGNSNWRGPVWFPVNYLMIESLQRYHHYFGDEFQGGMPHRVGRNDESGGASRPFCRGGFRTCSCVTNTGAGRHLATSKSFRPIRISATTSCFSNIFNGDNGAGLGANHQTGWTALVAKLLQQSGE